MSSADSPASPPSTDSRPATADVAVARSLRRAATVVVLRERASGMEVLLLRRAVRATDYSSDAYVFPGGVVDAGDRLAHDVCVGLDDAAASARLGLPDSGLDYFVAAMRECFEEAGLLFAIDAAGQPVDLPRLARLQARRDALHDGAIDIAGLCRQFDVRLAVDRLAYLSHWITPAALPKRFDTRFFVAVLPDGQSADADQRETASHRWMRPHYALTHADQLRLLPPTRKTLQTLAALGSVDAVMAFARSTREIAAITPRLAIGRRGNWPVTPDEPAWGELALVDPDDRGTGSYEIVPGRAVTLMPGLIRVTAGNPGMMTGPGTNTYLIGGGPENLWTVIDPGPDDDAHLDAILAAAPGPIRQIFVTHTHRDHSPGARALKARTDARTYGMPARHPDGQDVDFIPDEVLTDGETFTLAGGQRLRAIHTPGHAANHVCYWLEHERVLLTGDHVMQGSTVVINPPDGHMATYLASLRKVLALDAAWLAPGHGFMIDAPKRVIERLIAHRLQREARVLDALAQAGPADLATLVTLAYADTPAARHGVARRSLLAHLEKLSGDGQAVQSATGHWTRA